MTMSVVTSVSRVGSKKLPPCAARLPPVTTLAPFLTASAMCSSTFSTAFMSIKGADHGTRLEPVGDLHRPGGLGKALRERVIDTVLHQDPVGADAGLADILILRGDRAPCLRRGKLLTAISISASSKTMNGALPPSSSDNFLTVPAHCCIGNLPASVYRAVL